MPQGLPYEIVQLIIDYMYFIRNFKREQEAKEDVYDEEMIEGHEKSIEIYKYKIRNHKYVHEWWATLKLKIPDCIEIIKDIRDPDDDDQNYGYYGKYHIIIHLYKLNKNKRLTKWRELRSFLQSICMDSDLEYCR